MATHSPRQGTVARPPDDAVHGRSLLDLAAGRSQVDWLWPGWIPRGMLTLLAAAPGTGKSLVALDLARRVIAGLPFPDGALVPCPGSNVLLVDAEGPLSLLDQRARAWDLDRSHLFLMLPQRHRRIDLASAAGATVLIDLIRDSHPGLLIVDSLAAAVPGGESRRLTLDLLLSTLDDIARSLNLALLLIHHLRKRAHSGRPSTTPVAIDDLRGSSRIVAAARSVLALSPVPPDPFALESAGLPPLRRFEVIKSNLSRLPPPLGLVFEGGEAGAPLLRYTDLPLPPPAVRSQLELCAGWLLEHLAAAAEPVRPADLLQAAAEAGFPHTTVYRARRALGPRILDLGTAAHDPARRWALAPIPHAKTW